jgi:channel protein (hemolysin III family)
MSSSYVVVHVADDNLQRFFKYLDHSAVFLLIAGTYTPILAISLHSVF